MRVLAPPPHGRSEYLVDTENNSIIYPKTRLEDIIGLENFEVPDNPGQLLGGIDPNSYICKTVSLQGVPFNKASNNIFGQIQLAGPAIYFINLNLQLVELPAYSSYNSCSLFIETPHQRPQSDFLLNNSTYGRRSMSIIEKVIEPAEVVRFGSYIITLSFTCNGASHYVYTILKLCDIPQTD